MRAAARPRVSWPADGSRGRRRSRRRGRGVSGPSRWLAFRHALAYVAGFGSIFTLLGVTATFASAGFSEYLPVLRQVGGVLLDHPRPEPGRGPSAPGPRTDLAPARCRRRGIPGERDRDDVARVGRGGGRSGPGIGDRLGGRLVSSRGGWLASFGLGAIFAVGWTPCIGVILGAILGLASTSQTVGQGALLLVAYTAGLGLPFIAIALLYDRAPAIIRPLVRHGRAVSIIGGALVIAIGIAMVMDWLALLPRWFNFVGV